MSTPSTLGQGSYIWLKKKIAKLSDMLQIQNGVQENPSNCYNSYIIYHRVVIAVAPT